MRSFNVMAVVFFFFMASLADADQRVCGEGLVVVKAAVGQAVELVMENGVGDLVRSGDPSTVKVEHTSGHLFLTPLSLSPAELTIIDMRGRSYVIRCVFDQPAERRVTIADCASSEREDRQDRVMVLMRELIRGSLSAGATEQIMDRVMFDDGKVRMRAVLLQELPRLSGYVMVVENLTPGRITIPIQQIAFPGLLAVSAGRDVLEPAEKGNIYMVVGR